MTNLGWRPNCTSSACNFSNNDSGVSPSNGVNTAAALIKSGESGGQSTGVLRQREDRLMGFRESVCSSAKAD